MSEPHSDETIPAGETIAAHENTRLYQLLGNIPFWGLHAVAIWGTWHYGVSLGSAALCFAMVFVRLFGVTGGYHRYFAHRTYKTSRVFQFLLAFLAVSSSQKGVLWWAGHHRVHHKLSDQDGDMHSPVQRGFWYSHVGWLFAAESQDSRYDKIQDFAKYPELRWLDRNWLFPPVFVGALCLYFGGARGLFTGFLLSTALLWHITFTINSLSHVFGKRRFETDDDSRNNWFLGLLTLGEGWHNNHHHYQSSARNGFYWWEIDVTYYTLFALSKLGIVWDLRQVPDHVMELGRKSDALKREGIHPAPFVPRFPNAPVPAPAPARDLEVPQEPLLDAAE
jgi:stearoyl-CoA desaturase (delta-9 desaturase)